MLVIGFGHKARHGKDTVAQTIMGLRGDLYDISSYSFAMALKNEVNNTVAGMMEKGMDPEAAMKQLCEWASRKHCRNPDTGQLVLTHVPYDPNPDRRDPLCPFGKQSRLLQWWGSEYRRWADPNYWVRQVEEQILLDKPEIALITDVRFPNEFWWVRDKMKGETVKVSRLGFVDTTRDPNHPSENALNSYKFDHEIIVPDGQLEELKRDAVELFDIIAASCKPGPTFEEINRMVMEVDGDATVAS